MYPAGELVSRLLMPFGGTAGGSGGGGASVAGPGAGVGVGVAGVGPDQVDPEAMDVMPGSGVEGAVQDGDRYVRTLAPLPARTVFEGESFPRPNLFDDLAIPSLPSEIMSSADGPTRSRSVSPPPTPNPSPSSSTPALTPRDQSLLSHLTRSKLQRAAAGRMSGGRGAPSLRQLVLWTNTLVAPKVLGGEPNGWYDDAEEDEAGAQDGYGSHAGEAERKQAEQEWFENLMEEMVDVDEDEDEDDEDVGPAVTSTVPPTAVPVPIRSSPLSVAVQPAPIEDERYVSIRFRHRGRLATEADSGFLERQPVSSPLPDSFIADDDDGSDSLRLPDPLDPSFSLAASSPAQDGARTMSPPPPAVSALTAQLQRPEEVPLPISPSPSPERRVIVRDLDPAGEAETAASWASLLECEEVTLDAFSTSLPALPPSEPDDEEPGRSDLVLQPASWSSAEMPALTPDCSPPGVGFVGPSSVDDDAVQEHEACGWHRMLTSRRGILSRPTNVLHRAIEDPSTLDDGSGDKADGFGSWLLGSAPFATEDSLVSPPGLETMELGPVDESALTDRLNLLSVTRTSHLGALDLGAAGPSRISAKRKVFSPIVQLAESPPATTGFYVPPAPPPPPVLPSVLAPIRKRPWSSASSNPSRSIAALPVPHSLSVEPSDSRTDTKERAKSPVRWNGIVRTWFDCVDLGVCSSTGLAPFGTLAAGGSNLTDPPVHDEARCARERRAQEALAIVVGRPCAWRPDRDREASPSRLRAMDALDLHS